MRREAALIVFLAVSVVIGLGIQQSHTATPPPDTASAWDPSSASSGGWRDLDPMVGRKDVPINADCMGTLEMREPTDRDSTNRGPASQWLGRTWPGCSPTGLWSPSLLTLLGRRPRADT